MSTITMWRLWPDEIEPVQCRKVTAAYVWPVGGNGTREARASRWSSYHETWADAHAALLAKAEQDLDIARIELERARGRYGQIKGLQPPADAEVAA